MAETAICPLNIRRTSQISAMFFLYQKRMAKTLLGRRGAWEKGRTLLVWGLGSGIPYGRPFPGPVPGRIAASAEKPALPKTGSGKAEMPRWALRASPARPQPVPGGRFSKEEKPTPPAISSGRENRPKTHSGRPNNIQSRNCRRPEPVLGARTPGLAPCPRNPLPRTTRNRGRVTHPPPGPSRSAD